MICVCVLVNSHFSAFAQNVNFPDANLAAEIRRRLDIDEGADIPQTDLEKLTFLSAIGKGITNLTGLQYATGLKVLELNRNPILDFTPIRSLINLTDLSLTETGFSDSDISILEPLVNLVYSLYLDENRISDLQALVDVISANMPNLINLSISDNRFYDITPLTALKDQLTALNLNYIKISNFGLLSEFTNLTELDLSRTCISDLSPLSGLTNLTRLDLSENRISNLEPLRNLIALERLFIERNQISDLSPLSGLTKLRYVWACWNPFPLNPNPFASLRTLMAIQSFSVDTTYETQAAAVFPTNPFGFFCDPAKAGVNACAPLLDPSEPELDSESELDSEPEVKRRRYVVQCGLGWSPHSQYGHVKPKAMIYALEFEYDPGFNGGYSCNAIEIRTGDDSIENLAGWNLYLGTRYNPSYVPINLTEANSQITDGVLKLTPEMLGLQTFACGNAYLYGHIPSVRYDLKNENNVPVDIAYSCYLWGQIATTQVNGVWTKSARRISSAALLEMETPRIERYITKPNSVYITYIDIEEFGWDRPVFSDWLLPPSESPAPGAPSTIQRNLVTMWGALKKQ